MTLVYPRMKPNHIERWSLNEIWTNKSEANYNVRL